MPHNCNIWLVLYYGTIETEASGLKMLNVLGLIVIWAKNEENTFQVEEKVHEQLLKWKSLYYSCNQ